MRSRLPTTRFACLMIAFMMTAPHFQLWAAETKKPAVRIGVQNAVTDDPVDTSSDDEDDSGDEPSIKLPSIPPRRTSGGTPNRTSPSTMDGIDKSAFPGMTCPLIDNRPNKDLLNAIQALSRVVVVTPECQNNADIVKMSEEAKKLVAAGTSLEQLWNNPAALEDTKNLAEFQNNLSVLINGINKVTTTLQSNTLLNNKCGKELMTGSGVLLAVSDLISSFAPFALIGASMNPSLGAALPFILGFTGVGSVAKIIKGLHDQNSLDMSKPEHRQAIMQNVCEFSKIQQRVRFLKLAQSGQLELVTKELQGMRSATYTTLKSRFSNRVFSIAEIRNTVATMLSQSQNTLKRDQMDMRSVTAQLKGQNEQALVCFVAREVVKRSGDEKIFPTRAVKNLKNLIDNQKYPSLGQSALLTTEERLRGRLKAKINDDSSAALNECASIGKSYIESLSRILEGTQVTINQMSSSLEKQLSKDPEYAVFRKSEVAAQSEINNLAKVANILQRLNADNAVLDKVEMDIQMRGLKQALFGTPDGLPIIRGSSPAMAWLDFIDQQHAKSISSFNAEMRSLVRDAYFITRSGRMDFVRRNADGSVMKDRYGRVMPLSMMEQNEQLINDLSASAELKNLTAAIAPQSSDNQKAICQRLENIWLAWAAAMDHLAAEDFFCQNIKPFFDSTTESSLISRCVGRTDLAGRVLVPSEIRQKQSALAQKGFKNQALLVSSKMKELACEMPDASVMK
jgi:hypothetical protein